MVGGAQDLDAVLEKVGVSVAQCCIAADFEGDVHEPELAALRPRCVLRRGMLTRASKGVWNSRLQFTGDFETLTEALMAIDAAYPDADRIRCYEYTVDDEYAREVAPLLKSGGKWRPGGDVSDRKPPS